MEDLFVEWFLHLLKLYNIYEFKKQLNVIKIN